MTGIRLLSACLLWAAVVPGCEAAQASVAAPHEPRQPAPLFDNLGALHHAVTTSSDQAQRYFDQGLRLVYAFNHEEAVSAFEEAARLDPSAAMAYWGIALALGPNINAPMGKPQERRALEALRKARQHSAHLSAAERGYIEALSKRYGANGRPRVALDRAYADAMRSLWRQFPDDADAGVLFAEAMMDLHPWDLWNGKGEPKAGTEEIVYTLESVLSRFPDHPGACHYYIHAVEASPRPERALACAERLPGLMPGAGHLVHMPAHIYIRVGQYHESADRNAHAVDVDRAYLEGRNSAGDYADGYYTHNLHFLWASLAMEGRRVESMKIAREVARTITEEEARREKSKEQYLPTPIWTMIRFGQWSDMLREPVPDKKLRLHQGLWRLGRGLALAATGRLPAAEGELTVLTGLAKQLGRDRTSEEKTERAMLNIAGRLLAGEIAARRGKSDEAIRLLREGVTLEEGLPYSEPPFWPIPLRHYLGDVLSAAGRHGDAEETYRADLARNPRNGWALFGLTQSLRAQRRIGEAEEAERQFKAAWAHAEVTLTSSRF
jgi:tetratricopeptide (TPR) repeat protein